MPETLPKEWRICVKSTSIKIIYRELCHDDVIKWKHFPRYWPFVRSPANSAHKGQWRGALMFSLICVWINGWVNNREAGDLRRHCAHYDVIVMVSNSWLYRSMVYGDWELTLRFQVICLNRNNLLVLYCKTYLFNVAFFVVKRRILIFCLSWEGYTLRLWWPSAQCYQILFGIS